MSRMCACWMALLLYILPAPAIPEEAPDLRDPVAILEEYIAIHSGGGCGNSPTHVSPIDLPVFRALRARGVDLVTLLMEFIRRKDHSYLRRYWLTSEIPSDFEHADPEYMRERSVTRATNLLAQTRDPRVVDFLIGIFRDRSERRGIRWDACTDLAWFLKYPQVQGLVVEMLRDPEQYGIGRDLVIAKANWILNDVTVRGLRSDWTTLIAAVRNRLAVEREAASERVLYLELSLTALQEHNDAPHQTTPPDPQAAKHPPMREPEPGGAPKSPAATGLTVAPPVDEDEDPRTLRFGSLVLLGLVAFLIWLRFRNRRARPSRS